MEDYPSPAEGNGLENRQAGKTVQGFESLILLFHIIAGWSSLVARRAHNPKVVGSNPSPATIYLKAVFYEICLFYRQCDRRYVPKPEKLTALYVILSC